MAVIPSDQHITYQLQFRKCGKPSCSTCRTGQGHGPYWYAYWRQGSRLRSGYIGKVRPAGCKQGNPTKKKQKSSAAKTAEYSKASASPALM